MGLPEFITQLRSQGIRYLGYVNPFFVPGMQMCKEAGKKDIWLKRQMARLIG